MQQIRTILTFLVLSLLVIGSSLSQPVSAQSSDLPDLTNTIQYLTSQQLEDGGFPGLAEGSDPGTTARALLGLKAVNIETNQFVSADGKTPLGYLLENYESNIYDENGVLFPGNAGLLLTALSLYQSAPPELPVLILDTLTEDGSFSTDAVEGMAFGTVTDLSQGLAILGLTASGTTIPESAIEYLIGTQMDDGTWSNGFGSDPDTTALVVVALLSSGQIQNDHPTIQSALQYFRDTQLENGGWRPVWDSSSINVDSTGWITLALVTAGESLSDWEINGATPKIALESVIQPDGSIGEGFINVYSTAEALLGFASEPLIEPLSTIETSMDEPILNQAGLVIAMPDGSTILRCVDFSGETISGYDLLVESGLKLETSFNPGMGNAVCGIESQGCDSGNCFCGMPNYWSYWHVNDSEWVYAGAGANTHQVEPGTIDGWSWGDQPPASVTYNQICGEEAVLFLPAVVAEKPEPTNSVMLPLVESNTENQISETSTLKETPTQTQNLTTRNPTQYLIFGAVVLVLVALLALVLREKKNT